MTQADALERGTVYWVELDPVRGSEIAKTRPCVLLSLGSINRSRRTVVVVPLTSTPEAARFPLLVAVPSAGSNSKARIEHIRCVDKSRLQRRIGHLSPNDLDAIGRALLRVLGMG
ncbi:type II toxin-antitoxin system PemK/MazF family toxin [Serpentinimonas barnesii]|uniref:type II toxin-antitoxin system PemK/MazF family toxin n=1 Tax=Serpentinimonas barnesii TaxID=1458427 RepID=UPI00049606AF|nr:type II toxin-antitoxin system PemK/MazF family toxin [Serpentinimonas barnesii]